MYKSFTAEDYKKHFSLPENYEVEGFLSFGSWNEEKHRDEIFHILKENNVLYSFKVLS